MPSPTQSLVSAATLQAEVSWTSGTLWSGAVADATVLVDTGALAPGKYLFGLYGSGSVAWVYDVQWRNAANSANNQSQRRRPAAGHDDLLFPNKIEVLDSERLRLVLSGAVTGTIQHSIFWMRVG